ncbi:MAG: histidinol-phosphate aminotransferase family protein [Mogibacterium sp.]|nr:histidinol-phosphate aminotransferase family protein [Mogibacterium sp.]
MDGKNRLKIKKQLLQQEKISYAMDHIELPEGGVDCSEGCNPYGFPEECSEIVRKFDTSKLGPYPHSPSLYNEIREYWKDQIDVERENILLTDGSISALYIINNIFDTHNAVALGISPQFTDYYMHAEMIGIEYAPYQLDRSKNYKFDLDEFLDMHYEESNEEGVWQEHVKSYNFIYIDNPNNPTGQCIDIEDIERIVEEARKFDITVIIDEAYGDFMPRENSAIKLFSKYPNLIVVRTMSKGFGLAGMRAGYIIAHKDMIRYMNKMVNPYMVGELTREVAAEALRHGEFIEKSMNAFAEMKGQIRKVLGCTSENPAGDGHLHMAETLDTNSLLMLYHDNAEINLKKEFWKRGVLVIDGNDFKGLDSSAARVRLPIMEEFPVLLKAIEEINKLDQNR